MESIFLLFLLLMRDAIKFSFEKLEPFMNIKEQDGIYFYNVIILLKIVFVLYTVAFFSRGSYCDTCLFFAVTNALTVVKYPPASVLLLSIQGLILPALSKKYGLFSCSALFYVLSMNIKRGEFLLDLYVVTSLIMNSLRISPNEHHALCIYIKITIICYLYNLHTYNLRLLSLISCFLFLKYNPLMIIIQNSYKRNILYCCVLLCILIALYSSTGSHETQSLTRNLEFNKKWGYYQSSVMSDNAEKKTAQKFRNPEIGAVSEEILTPKSIFDNLTSYSEIQENTCKVDDEKKEKNKSMDENFKSLSIDESNLSGKVKKYWDSMKLDCENECSKDDTFNAIYDVEILEKNLNSKKFKDFFEDNALRPIDSKNNDENYPSIDNKISLTANNEEYAEKRSMMKYIGQYQNTPDKFEQYNDIDVLNAKVIKCTAIINEHNCSDEFKPNMDKKDNFIANFKHKNSMEYPLQDISRRKKKFTSVVSDEIQKTSERKKVVSFQSQSLKSSGKTDNVTIFERCLHELGKVTNDEKVKQIEQMLIDVSNRKGRLKLNLGVIHKIKEDKHVGESTNGNLQDKDLSVEKDTEKTYDGKSQGLNFKISVEENKNMKHHETTRATTKYKGDQILDEDIGLENSFNSIQKKESENKLSIKGISSAKKSEKILVTSEEKNSYKPIRESKQLLVVNNKKHKDPLKNEKNGIKCKESRIKEDNKNTLILNEEITLRNTLDSIQKEENNNKVSGKSVSTTKSTRKILITSDEEVIIYKPSNESKKLVLFNCSKYKERLKNEKNVAQYEGSQLNESLRACKYGKNSKKDELMLHKCNLKKEIKTVRTLKKSRIRKRIIQDSPHILVFKSLGSIKRENNAQLRLKRQILWKCNIVRKELEFFLLEMAINIQKHSKLQNNESRNDAKKKMLDDVSNIRKNSELFENIELKDDEKLDSLLRIQQHSNVNLGKNNPVERSKFEKSNIIEVYKRKPCTLYSLKKIIQNIISNNWRNSIHRENKRTRNT